MKLPFLVLLLLLIFSTLTFSNETDETENNKDLIKIVQKSSTRFRFYKNDELLYSKWLIADAIKDVPKAQEAFLSAHRGYVRSCVMLGLGIGFASLSSYMLVFSSIFLSLNTGPYIHTLYDYYPIYNVWFWITAGFGLSLIGSIVMWALGAVYKGIFRLKKVDAISFYNREKKKNSKREVLFTLAPHFSLDKNFDPNTGIILSAKF